MFSLRTSNFKLFYDMQFLWAVFITRPCIFLMQKNFRRFDTPLICPTKNPSKNQPNQPTPRVFYGNIHNSQTPLPSCTSTCLHLPFNRATTRACTIRGINESATIHAEQEHEETCMQSSTDHLSTACYQSTTKINHVTAPLFMCLC